MKKTLAILLALIMVLGVFGAMAENSTWDGAYMDEDDYKAYIEYDLTMVYDSIAAQLDEETDAAAQAALEEGY